MKSYRKRKPLIPNEIAGVVRVVEIDYAHFGRQSKTMTVLFEDGTEGRFPLIVSANPLDKFIFTIRPA